MNGVHDMGGMHGFGPMDLGEHGQAIFHAAWEPRARAPPELPVEQGFFTVAAARHRIELIEPAHYLRSNYFERWLISTVHNLILQGFLTADELEARTEELIRNPEATFALDPASIPAPPASHLEPEPTAPPSPNSRWAIRCGPATSTLTATPGSRVLPAASVG